MVRIENKKIILTGSLIKKRSYSTGRQHYFRLKRKEKLKITIEIEESENKIEKATLEFEKHINGERFESDLKPTPGNKFEGIISFDFYGVCRFKAKYLKNGNWYRDNVVYSYMIIDPEYIDKISIYTMIPGASGKISDWIKAIPEIRDMGFNTIHILPVTETGSSGSPYAAAKLFQMDPLYYEEKHDGFREFDKFIKALIKNKIRLCVDLVLNHVALESKIRNNYPDWLAEDPDEADGIKRAGWSEGEKWHKWSDLAFINYTPFTPDSREALWEYMTGYALFWARYAAMTGGMIRLDNLHSSYKPFLQYLLREVREKYPSLIIIGEIFTHEKRLIRLTLEYGINLLLATPWEHKFVPEIRKYLKHLHSYKESLRFFFPICSHDSGSPAEEFGDVKSTIPRMILSALAGPGPSGIVQGVEYGIKKRIDFINQKTKLEISSNYDFTELFEELNKIVRNNNEFQIPGNIEFVDNNHEAVIGIIRKSPKTGLPSFIVLINFDIKNPQELYLNTEKLNIIKNKQLLNLFNGETILPGPGKTLFSLPPCGFLVYRIK